LALPFRGVFLPVCEDIARPAGTIVFLINGRLVLSYTNLHIERGISVKK
jgi:hypothetical protein